MIISQIEPLFNGRSPATGVKKGEKLTNKRIYLHSDNFRIMSTIYYYFRYKTTQTMRFECSVTINQPLEKVVALFKDPKSLKEYQRGFLRKELLNGVEGEEGAVSKLYYRQGDGEMELTETIVTNQLPNTFLGRYHHKHMDNTMESSFKSVNALQSRYVAVVEYTEFRGIMPKMMAFFFPSTFKEQTQLWLENFKKFAERN